MITCKCGRTFTHYRYPVHCACGIVMRGPNGVPSNSSHWPALHQYAIDNTETWDALQASVWLNDWSKRIPGGCDCEGKWANYCESNPPNLNTANEFFEWSVTAHNYVSTHHANNPTITLNRAWSIYGKTYYNPVASDLKQLSSKHSTTLVITVAAGEAYENLLKDYTASPMKAYAKRIGADFITLTGITQKWWGLEKFRIGPIASHYERTLFVDADVLIKTDAPNIFNEVPIGHVAMANDWELEGNHNWHRTQRQQLWESQDVPPLYPEHLRNSGVVVVDQMHADIWTPPLKRMPENHVDEQFWIERWSRFYDFHQLDMRWNNQWYYPDFSITKNSAYFLHFACCPMPERIKQLKKELSI